MENSRRTSFRVSTPSKRLLESIDSSPDSQQRPRQRRRLDPASPDDPLPSRQASPHLNNAQDNDPAIERDLSQHSRSDSVPAEPPETEEAAEQRNPSSPVLEQEAVPPDIQNDQDLLDSLVELPVPAVWQQPRKTLQFIINEFDLRSIFARSHYTVETIPLKVQHEYRLVAGSILHYLNLLDPSNLAYMKFFLRPERPLRSSAFNATKAPS